MLQSKVTKTITFTDGRLRGLVIDKTSQAITGQSSVEIPCGLPTVGYKRFYEAARTEGLQVDLVATVPWMPELFDYEIVELERNDYPGKYQYRIIQNQERRDSAPPCFQLTLQKLTSRYADQRNT